MLPVQRSLSVVLLASKGSWNQESLRDLLPLITMDNVIVTAHTASDSTDAFAAVFRGLVDDILLLLDGRRPSHVVNPAVLEHERWKGLE